VNRDDLEASILAFLRDELRIDTSEIQRDTELVSGGVVDSTDLVRLATRLERNLDIEIPDQDISADNFDSIEMIIKYVSGKLSS
jgi:D-alanine--poly(phosphoribitol) ligase subunit 2